jgi:tetraprenyl-beta-curcumene synthase
MREGSLPAGRLALLGAYIHLAANYWLDVAPQVRRHVRGLNERARQIPDPSLRAVASGALRTKQANLEGAAAFAVFAPRSRRRAAVGALVAFQALCDYLDTLSERQSAEVAQNSERLHTALSAALAHDRPHVDYYAFCAHEGDDGYLVELVERCRTELRSLPSYARVAPVVHALVEDAARFQSLNFTERQGGHARLARWASGQSWGGARLYWWEAAAANSTPALLALLGAAARPTLGAEEATAIASAYRPWFEALHTLLDSVVDELADAEAGQRSLLHYYGSPSEAASRLGLIASEAVRGLGDLPKASTHGAILAAMAGFYLCPAPATPTGNLASGTVLEAMGFLARPTVLMFGARHKIRRLRSMRGHVATVAEV